MTSYYYGAFGTSTAEYILMGLITLLIIVAFIMIVIGEFGV